MLAGCGTAGSESEGTRTANGFPRAHRPVAPTVSGGYSTEATRDRLREAQEVMRLAEIEPGMTVADIGAGEGYYTIRLAQRVGKQGRVLAQDIVPAYRDRLAERVARERLDNVSVKLGDPADPKLPDRSFDRIFLVHMYHEIGEPYEFLWRMRPALRPHGIVVVVDADRPTGDRGTPPALLDCEMNAVGYTRILREKMPEPGTYLATYVASGPRPAPEEIKGCVPAAS
nr:class I SAM-dependent methyltransferase [Sphingomonas oleivorans]